MKYSLYTYIQYNDKTRYNDNLNGTNPYYMMWRIFIGFLGQEFEIKGIYSKSLTSLVFYIECQVSSRFLVLGSRFPIS